MDTSRAQTVGDINTGEDQKEEESGGCNKDILDNPHREVSLYCGRQSLLSAAEEERTTKGWAADTHRPTILAVGAELGDASYHFRA